jgi:hypothetical protein
MEAGLSPHPRARVKPTAQRGLFSTIVLNPPNVEKRVRVLFGDQQ